MLSDPFAFLELIDAPALVADPGPGVILAVNGRACRVHGLAREALVGRTLEQLWLGDGVRTAGISCDGKPALLVVQRVQEAGETELSRLEALVLDLQFALDRVTAAVVLVDEHLRVVHANGRALAFSDGGDACPDTGSPLEEGAGLWPAAAKLARIAFVNGTEVRGTVEAEPGQPTWTISVSPRALPAGARAAIVISDTRAIAELESEIQRVEAVARFGNVVAGVAQEVRTPLFALATTVESIAGFVRDDDERGRQRYAMIRAQVERLNALVRDLLQYGEAAALDLSQQTLDGAVAEAVALSAPSARSYGVGTRNDFPSMPETVLIDSARVVAALRNVLENALQHAPAGSTVVVRGGVSPARDRVLCIVEDDGAGFRPEDLPYVMEPFFTRRNGGTGLGLAIVQRIVQLHGGNVIAENRDDALGARVTIELPRAD